MSRVSGHIDIHWISNARKLVCCFDFNNKLIGKKYCSNEEFSSIVNEIGAHEAVVKDLSPTRRKTACFLRDVTFETIVEHKLNLLPSARDEELAGKEWIREQFLGSLGSKCIDGEVSWFDQEEGSNLVFRSNGERFYIPFKLEDIEDVVVTKTVQSRILSILEHAVEKLPSKKASPLF